MLFIGLMSGTSMDGIDAALVDIECQNVALIHAIAWPIPAPLRQEIEALCVASENEIHRMAQADRWLGAVLANAANALVKSSGVQADQVCAIGSHGQTIRHFPDENPGYTIQIGDPNTIAELTGITTVADFRRRDIAAGGQGAPLIPRFHDQMLLRTHPDRVVLNLGGMANISFVTAAGEIKGYDTGPANVLLDYWAQKHLQQPCDTNGHWGRGGKMDEQLLSFLLDDDYFALPAPKSTGRERFNPEWLNSRLASFAHTHPERELLPADVQATLTELTAVTVANEVSQQAFVRQVICCGGGSHNRFLLSRLQKALPTLEVKTSDDLGIPSDWMEAMGFAWFAYRALNSEPISLSAATGASHDCVCGGIFPGQGRLKTLLQTMN